MVIINFNSKKPWWLLDFFYMIFLCGIWMIFPDAVFDGTNAGPNWGRIVTSEPLSWVWGTSHVIPTASSRGLSDGGSGVGESVACNDSRLCTSSCCLCGNRWEYVLSVVDTFSCPSLSANISASQPWLISKLACECLISWIRIFFTSVFLQPLIISCERYDFVTGNSLSSASSIYLDWI